MTMSKQTTTDASPALATDGGQAGISIDYKQLAAELASAMNGVTVQLDGQAVGRLVAPSVGREIWRETQSKRYTK